MSRHPPPSPPVPEATARVARTALPPGHLDLMRRAALGPRCRDDACAALVPTRGPPAEAPWRLALVTSMPDVEEVSDRQAAEAVRGRIAWQDALSLERTAPGVDRTVLREWRPRWVVGSAAPRRLEAILDRGRARQGRNARGRPRTDSTPVRARVRAVNRFAWVGDTRRQTLHRRAVVAPEWRHTPGPAAWEQREGRRLEDDRVPPRTEARHASAPVSGAEGSA
jgi:transposase